MLGFALGARQFGMPLIVSPITSALFACGGRGTARNPDVLNCRIRPPSSDTALTLLPVRDPSSSQGYRAVSLSSTSKRLRDISSSRDLSLFGMSSSNIVKAACSL